MTDHGQGATSINSVSGRGFAGNWIVGATTCGRGLRRRLLNALRMAHRVLGVGRAGRAIGPMGVAGGGMRGGIGMTVAGALAVPAALLGGGAASAQAVPVVGACSGVQLPRSVVTDILRPVITGVVAPIEDTVNPVLGVVRIIPIVGQVLPPLSIDTTTLLADAAAGQPITLNVLSSNGVLVGPADACNVQADSFQLRNPQGIAIGGNRITGLGTGTVAAAAGEGTSVAFGNAATTAADATGAIAFGTDAGVGAGATGGIALGTGAQVTAAGGTAIGAGALAARGALVDYAATGLAGLQTSAGEVSVGAAGAARQITNVAAGSEATDAVNVAQLQGVAAQVGVLDARAVRYDAADQGRITLAGTGGTVIDNVAPGQVAAGSTEAVNGDQLFATNGAVTTLTTNITNGAVGAVRYSDAATPTVPNGGVPTNDVAVVGAVAGAVGVHNVRDGALAAGSLDAVNGGQLFATNTQLAATGDAVTNTNTAITNLTTNVSNGAVGTVRYSDPGNAAVPNGGTPTNELALVGAVAGTVGLHNVGPGVVAAGSTDAVNGDQLFATNGAVTTNSSAITNLSTAISNGGVGILRFSDAGNPNVANGGVPSNDAVLVGAAAGSVGLHNVAAGALAAGSTDAVNGDQLFATNTQLAATGDAVTNVSNAVTNLATNVSNGAVGTVRYSDPGNPAVPNGGAPTNDLTLVGGAAGAVGLHNVADGGVAAGSTDAVNGGQLFAVGAQVDLLNGLAVRYDDATRTAVTLGGAGAGPVLLSNVQGGSLAAGSSEAVNGGQLGALGAGVAGAIGGGTAYDPATNALAVQLTYNGAQYGTVQDVVSALSNTVVGGTASRFFAVNSGGAPAVAAGVDTVAIGPNAQAAAAGSVALGANAGAVRGAQAGYAAAGLATPQTSVGEVSVGAVGAERQVTNVAAGSAATDAVNVAQLQAVSAGSVRYDDAAQGRITLAGAGGTVIGNVAAGAVNATSTDAVNGAQLDATNQAVAGNSSAITTLTNSVANGSVGAVQYSNAATPTTPNGGTRTNDVVLVGADAGSVGLHNVRDGVIALGSTDAVNGGQVFAIGAAAVNAVQYGTDANGNRSNTVALIGGNASAPVTIANVAGGSVAAGSTQAVNGGQLFATNQGVAAAQATATSALGLGQNSVQYDAGRTAVTFNGGGNAVALRNVAAGVNPTDGVNVAQLNAGIGQAVSDANAYTDTQIGALSYDLRSVRRNAYAGTAGAMAVAALPQALAEGKGMLAMAAGTYMGQAAFAIGGSKILNDGRAVAKVGATLDSRSRVGASAGFGFQF